MKQVEIKLLGRDFMIACPEEEEANLQKSIKKSRPNNFISTCFIISLGVAQEDFQFS